VAAPDRLARRQDATGREGRRPRPPAAGSDGEEVSWRSLSEMPATRSRIAHRAGARGTHRPIESRVARLPMASALPSRKGDFGTSRRQLADRRAVRAGSISSSPPGKKGAPLFPNWKRAREEWAAAASYFTSFTPVTASRFL